jgi:hypothetical protein
MCHADLNRRSACGHSWLQLTEPCDPGHNLATCPMFQHGTISFLGPYLTHPRAGGVLVATVLPPPPPPMRGRKAKTRAKKKKTWPPFPERKRGPEWPCPICTFGGRHDERYSRVVVSRKKGWKWAASEGVPRRADEIEGSGGSGCCFM